MERIKFFIEFLFGDKNQLFIKVSATWQTKPINVAMSSFLTFLYQQEGQLDAQDVEFSCTLAKLLKKVRWDHEMILAIADDADQTYFFQKVVDHKIDVIWVDGEDKIPLKYKGTPLPLEIQVNQQTSALSCEMKNWHKFIDNPMYGLTFADDQTTFLFCNGVMIKNPSRNFSLFLARFLDKQRVYYYNEDAISFIKMVYEPNKRVLEWDIQANFEEILPAEDPPVAYLELNMANDVLMPTLKYKYAGILIDSNSSDQILKDKTGKMHHRMPDMEKIYQDDLMALFVEHNLPFMLESPGDIATFMDRVVPVLKDRDWQVKSNVPEFKIHPDPVTLEFQLTQDTNKNWFSYNPNCEVLDQNVSLQEIARLMVQNQGYLKTKSGYVKVSNRSQQQLKTLEKMGALRTGAKFSKAEILPLISVTETKGSDTDTRSMIDRIKNIHQLTQTNPGENFKGELRDYQQFGLNWINYLSEAGFGGILADDMGLGKTIQTLAFVNQMNDQGLALVVGPTNVIYNWKQEVRKFLPDKRVLVYTGPDRHEKLKRIKTYNIFVTSFGIVKNDIEILSKIPFKAIFVDEAQYIKNPRTKISQALKSLKSPFRLAMTGTPIENHIQDLWNLFDFVMPKYLGPQNHFENMFKEGSADLIKTKIRPFVLRREKQEVLDSLPPKTEIVLKCPLSDAQQTLYQTVLKAAKSGIKNMKGQNERLNVLTALLKLRQVCIHPGLLDEFSGQAIESAKFEMAKEKIEEILDEGHKIVMFSQFTKMLDIIQDWSQGRGHYVERIDGSVTGKKRIEAVERFQTTDKAGVFLISLKAGGVGINLTSADYVIHLDPWWNPAIESQATDRVHRMGQKNKVIVYKLITEGTVEEKIQQLQHEKRQLLGQIIDIDSVSDKKVDFEALKEILLD